MELHFYLHFAFILVTLTTVSRALFAQDEYNLRQLKLGVASGYSRVVRPTKQVNVEIKFSLLAVNGLDTRGQSLSTTGWLTVKWHDPRLTWTPASHGNIDFLFETQKVLWRPELLLDNAVDALGVIGDDDLMIRVAHTGEVLWEPPELFTTSCEIDVTHYPFDRQRCILEITSWAYTINEVNLTHVATQVSMGDYSLNGEWHVQVKIS